MQLQVSVELISKAYEVGKSRGTSLSLGYFVSPSGETIFCQNPSSPEGMLVTHEGISHGNCPVNFQNFNMSEALS